MIAKHEEKIANPLLEYLSNRKDIKLIGKTKIENKDRAPTISIVPKNKKSKELSDFLVSKNIATRNDNFYAWRCLQNLGIDINDGVVRLSLVHYNTEKEIKKLIEIIDLFS